jgi:dihydrolipoamide dehydrogenase
MAAPYDVIVIGSGTGGYVAAIRAAQLGLRTAVVERQSVLGGTCLNRGCIPTKALLEHAHVYKLAQGASEWGISFGGAVPAIEMAQIHARKNRIVAGLTKGVEFLFQKNRIDWIKGTARLAGGGRIDVTGGDAAMFAASEIVVATGSAPRSLTAVPIDGTHVVTSDEAIHLPELPKSVAILGSGAVGVEFASIFRQFGSDVVLIELQPRLVPSEDVTISAELEKIFRRRGIGIRTSTEVSAASVGAGGVALELRGTDGVLTSLAVQTLLVAIGRGPFTEGLGVDEAGVKLDRGFIAVDELYRTSVPGISAIGDVIALGAGAHPQLAHLSSAEGILAIERIAGRRVQPLNYDHVPACTYCDPEIASVGLTELEAVRRGYEVSTGMFPFSALGRARIAGETAGFIKVVAEKGYDQLLGVHIIGPRATELIGEATVALRLESTVEELIRTIHAHPTMSEAIGEAAHAAHGAAIQL